MSRVLPPLIGLVIVVLFGAWHLNQPPPPGPVRFLKGQLHLHTNRSGDGHESPAEVARWYQQRGYDFIVFTDHNVLTPGTTSGKLLAFPGVELTTNLEHCEPAAPAGLTCNLHLNALFVDPEKHAELRDPVPSIQRLDVYGRELDLASTLGGLSLINHPNFRYGADGPLLTQLAHRGARLVEIANEASDSTNEGDAQHPSTEALWDEVTTSGETLFGVASDDAHDFSPDAAERAARGEYVFPGDLGFVMVRATKEASSIRAALERGDFYASTGVVLSRLDTNEQTLTLEVAEPAEFRFIGDGGRELARSMGRSAHFALTGAETHFVRAVVTDARGKKAWTQPLRLSAR